MTSLNSSQIAAFETRLNGNRSAILKKIRSHLHGSEEADEFALANRLNEVGDSAAIAETLTDTDIAMLKHELAELRDIQAALQRIKSGVYGICANCGEDIPAARLGAQPTAGYCLQCQDKFERQQDPVHPHTPR